MNRVVDVILIGQGIAGTTLAWRMLDAGLSILILDREENVTSSRIAAGLMTPITGKRLALTQDWKRYWTEAVEFYRNVENRTKTSFFEEKQMLRLFQSVEERELFETKEKQFEQDVRFTKSPELPESLRSWELGGFGMMGGQLRVSQYLDASRKHFQSIESYEEVHLEVDSDLQFKGDEVSIPKLKVAAKHIIFCQGFQSSIPKQFEKVKFNPSKGEILTVSIEDFLEERILHKGFWVAHQNGNEYRVGATYDWNDLSKNITEKSRNWITNRLKDLIFNPYEVLNQQAAVRPTISDFQPVVGMHPKVRNIGMLNGLGSKGSLTAPRLANFLTKNILHGTSIPKEISLSRWFN